jgi:hypothetical protein
VYLASVKRLLISRPVHLSSMNLDEEEEEDDLFSKLWVLLTSIVYLNSTPFSPLRTMAVLQISSQVHHPHHMVSLKR